MRLVARRSEIKHNIKLRMDSAIPDGQIHFVDDDTGHRQVFDVTANPKLRGASPGKEGYDNEEN